MKKSVWDWFVRIGPARFYCIQQHKIICRKFCDVPFVTAMKYCSRVICGGGGNHRRIFTRFKDLGAPMTRLKKLIFLNKNILRW